MKITKCTHVTATEKKHLKLFLESGLTNAKINTKHYSIVKGWVSGDAWGYRIRITTPTKNDVGKTIYNTQTVELIY